MGCYCSCWALQHASSSGHAEILLTHTVGGCSADSVACSCGCGSAPSRLSPGGTAIIGPGQMPANAGGIVALSPVSSPPWPIASQRWIGELGARGLIAPDGPMPCSATGAPPPPAPCVACGRKGCSHDDSSPLPPGAPRCALVDRGALEVGGRQPRGGLGGAQRALGAAGCGCGVGCARAAGRARARRRRSRPQRAAARRRRAAAGRRRRRRRAAALERRRERGRRRANTRSAPCAPCSPS